MQYFDVMCCSTYWLNLPFCWSFFHIVVTFTSLLSLATTHMLHWAEAGGLNKSSVSVREETFNDSNYSLWLYGLPQCTLGNWDISLTWQAAGQWITLRTHGTHAQFVLPLHFTLAEVPINDELKKEQGCDLCRCCVDREGSILETLHTLHPSKQSWTWNLTERENVHNPVCSLD